MKGPEEIRHIVPMPSGKTILVLQLVTASSKLLKFILCDSVKLSVNHGLETM